MPIFRRLALLTGFAILLIASQLSVAEPQSAPPAANKTAPAPANPAQPEEIVRQSRSSFYSLKAEGVSDFRCMVQPDWDSIFKQLNSDPNSKDEGVVILKKTRFRVVVGPGGATSLTHDPDATPSNEQSAQGVRQTRGGMEKVIAGFLQTWATFTFDPPLPKEGEKYDFETLGDKYRLSSREGPAEVKITLNRQLAIESLLAITPGYTGTVNPAFSQGKHGRQLSGYDAAVKIANGETQKLSVKLDYQDVQGFQLPAGVQAAMELPTGLLTVPLRFSECQVRKQ